MSRPSRGLFCVALCSLFLALTLAIAYQLLPATGSHRLSSRIQVSASPSVDSSAPAASSCASSTTEAHNYPEGRLRFAMDATAARAECSLASRPVANSWSVCLVGPMRPRAHRCIVLAPPAAAHADAHARSSEAVGRSLAAAFNCRLLLSPPSPSPSSSIDILLLSGDGSGAAAWAQLAAAVRQDWLSGVKQLLLFAADAGADADSSSSSTSSAGAAAKRSLLRSLHMRGFRQWLRSGDNNNDSSLHFLNQAVLLPQGETSPPPPPPPPPPLPRPVSVGVALLRSFDLAGVERQVATSLASLASASREWHQEALYFDLIKRSHASCLRSARIGDAKDGGWDVCFSAPMGLRGGGDCLAFSFGINYIFSYDDALAARYNCTVRMFDPSMRDTPDLRRGGRRQWFYQRGLAAAVGSTKDGWRMHGLCDLLDEFAPSGQPVDILKIDIELWEWESLEAALAQGCLGRVKQLLFESHTTLSLGQSPNYAKYLAVWRGLLRAGFRQWKWHENPLSHFYSSLARGGGGGGSGSSKLACCYEHYMINWNFVEPLSNREV